MFSRQHKRFPRTVMIATALAALLLALLIPAPAAQAGAVSPAWSRQMPAEARALYVRGIAATGAGEAWAVGNLGSIWSFDGTSWWPVRSGGSTFRGICAVNSSNIFAVDEGRNFWRCDGSSWTISYTWAGTWRMTATSFYDSMRGFAVGEDGSIFYTSNGGVAWTDCALPAVTTDYYAVDVDGSNPAAFQVWVAGANGEVKKQSFDPAGSGPQAAGWTEVQTGDASSIRSVDFADGIHGWAVHADGHIYSSGDGGAAWSDQHTASSGLNAVKALSATDAWAGGPGRRLPPLQRLRVADERDRRDR